MSDLIQLNSVFKNNYGVIAKAVMQDRNLHISAKGLYGYLCSFNGTGGDVFLYRSEVCHDLQISKDTFAKYLKSLVDNGYVGIQQIRENGRFSHNAYTLFY